MNKIIISTVGFKGVVPYITILDMIFKKKINYIFEKTKGLITLPLILLEFNFDLIKKYKEVFSKIHNDYITQEEFENAVYYDDWEQFGPYIIK